MATRETVSVHWQASLGDGVLCSLSSYRDGNRNESEHNHGRGSRCVSRTFLAFFSFFCSRLVRTHTHTLSFGQISYAKLTCCDVLFDIDGWWWWRWIITFVFFSFPFFPSFDVNSNPCSYILLDVQRKRSFLSFTYWSLLTTQPTLIVPEKAASPE